MKAIFFLLLVFIMAASCDTPEALQPNETDYFLKFYGNDGDQTGVDFVVNDDDGTFVLVGTSKESITSDEQIYIVKVGRKGEIKWDKIYGSSFRDEEAKDIELLKNGEIVIAGNSRPKNATTQSDVYLLKLSQVDGSLVDSIRQITTSIENVSSVTEITAASDSSELIVAGSIKTDAQQNTDAMHMRFRTDKNSNKLKKVSELEWKTRPTFANFGFSGNESATKVEQLDDNTFFVFGTSKQLGSSDFWYYTLNNTANAPLNSTFIGEPNRDETLTSVARSGFRVVLMGTGSGSVVTVVLPFPPPSSPSVTNALSLRSGQYSQPSVAIGKNGYWVATQRTSASTSDIVLARTNANGSVDIEHSFGEALESRSGTVAELPDGRVVTIGTMALGGTGNNNQKKMVFMKLNPNGKLAP